MCVQCAGNFARKDDFSFIELKYTKRNARANTIKNVRSFIDSSYGPLKLEILRLSLIRPVIIEANLLFIACCHPTPDTFDLIPSSRHTLPHLF